MQMVIFGSRGQNAKQSVSIAILLGYRDIASCVRGFDPRNVCRAHASRGFTAIYADGGMCGISPATRDSDPSNRQLCFTWCRLPQM
eukprot:6212887-Pleurochrysis_carterae.AAC.4